MPSKENPQYTNDIGGAASDIALKCRAVSKGRRAWLMIFMGLCSVMGNFRGASATIAVDETPGLAIIPIDDWMKTPNDLTISNDYLNVVVRGDGNAAFRLFFPAFGRVEATQDVPRFGTVGPDVVRSILVAMNKDHFLSLPANSKIGVADAVTRTYHLSKGTMTWSVSVDVDDRRLPHTFLALLRTISDLPALTSKDYQRYCDVISVNQTARALNTDSSSQCVHELITDFPPFTGQAWFWPATFLENEKRYSEADRLFKELLRTYPQSQVVPNALFEDGMCLEFLGHRQGAIAQFRTLIANYPNAKYAQTARLELAESLYRLGQYDSALAAYVVARKTLPADYDRPFIDSKIALCKAKLASGQRPAK